MAQVALNEPSTTSDVTKAPARRLLLRGLVVALLAGLCLWMLLDPSSRQGRRTRLNEIRAQGGLPALSEAERLALESEFDAIARQIGTREAIRVNQPLRDGHLAIWITTSSKELFELTRTDDGNAVYDATLDAVFIDRSLVTSEDLLSVYSHSSYSAVASFNGAPYLRTLLQFVFAHELAHREHHRVSAGAFDAGRFLSWLPWSRSAAHERELEADRYAFAALMRLYSHQDQRWTALFPRLSAPIYDIPVEDLADARQAASLELASAFLMATTAQFFTGTPYSGYYEDTAHPNIFARMNVLLRNLAETLPASDPVRGLGALKLVVERLSRPLAIPVVEVISPWPIGMAGGSSEELRMVGADDLKTVEIPWRHLGEQAQRHQSERIEPHDRREFVLAPPGPRELATPKGFLYAFTEAGRERSLPQGFPLPQPGDYVASGYNRFADQAVLTVVEARGTKTCKAPLLDPRQPDRGTPELGRGLATRLAMYIELLWLGEEEGSKAAGSRTWLRIDPRSCRSTLITYRVPGDLNKRWRQGLWSFVFTDGVERPVWVGPLGLQSVSSGWGVWDLGDGAGDSPIVRVPSPYPDEAGMPPWMRRFFEWKLAEVGPLSEDGLFVNVGNEGIFAVRLKKEGAAVKLVWPVGDEVFTVIPIANGAIIFFLKGGRKCYVAFPLEDLT